jgi:hypothetical protein
MPSKKQGAARKASPAVRSKLQQMKQAIVIPGQRLGPKDLERIFKNDQALAEHLASLSSAQVEGYKQALLGGSVPMEKPVRDTLLKLLDLIQREALEREHAYTQQIAPFAAGLATAMQLQDKIQALERIQSDLRS